MKESLPDIQNERPKHSSVIHRVGVNDVELPFYLILRDGGSGPHQVNAKTEMVCMLDKSVRGISMSRFIRILQKYLKEPLRRSTIELILKDFAYAMDSSTASIKFDFKFPKIKESPLSDNEFPQYYKCSFKSVFTDEKFKFYESVRVPYSAYCPCSAALTQNGKYGYPHAQRAYADVLLETHPRAYVWLENIIDLVEKSVKTIPYPIIKRGDEKYIAGVAKSNPQFVEDSIREISHRLGFDREILDWWVKCTHEESIHTSNAIAINWKGKEGGFNETTYI